MCLLFRKRPDDHSPYDANSARKRVRRRRLYRCGSPTTASSLLRCCAVRTTWRLFAAATLPIPLEHKSTRIQQPIRFLPETLFTLSIACRLASLYLIAQLMSHIMSRIPVLLRDTIHKAGLSRRKLGWALRLAFIFFLISMIQPPTSRAPLGEPQRVETTKPPVCVHTLLENEVYEWKIKRSLELVREMGATTIVQFFPWAYFEPGENRFVWDQADRIIRHAENQGIRVIARLGLVPEWARPSGPGASTTLNYLPEESFDEFAKFAAEFAARYIKQIEHFIIWNEPNLSFEWGYRPRRSSGVYASPANQLPTYQGIQ